MFSGGPVGDILSLEGWKTVVTQGAFALWSLLATYALYLLWQAYAKVQDQRLKDAQDMQEQYQRLVEHINQTLNLLVQTRKK